MSARPGSSAGTPSGPGSRARSSGRASETGSIVLLSGEAGVGKTPARRGPRGRIGGRAPARRAQPGRHRALRPGGRRAAQPPALEPRRASRSRGPLRAQLALLLPELGDPAPAADRPTLFEAMRCAFAHVAAERHALVVLDDLQWSDEATLELLSALAEPLGRAAGAGDRRLPLRRAPARPRRSAPAQRPAPHRSARRARAAPARSRGDHRAAGADARRASVAVARARDPRPHRGDPVLRRGAGRRAARQRRGAARAARARALRRRRRAAAGHGARRGPDQRVRALRGGPHGGRGRGRRGRDVRSRADRRALERRRAVRAASTAGSCARTRPAPPRSGTRSRARRSTPTCRGCGGGRCTARSPRRSRARAHRAARSRRHWLGARAGAPAREALLRAAAESEAVHAYRDAAAAGRQALELWPESGDEERRGEALERYARCSRLAGELAEAARAWRELGAIRGAAGDERAAGRRAARARGGAGAEGRPRGGVRGAPHGGRGLRGHTAARPRRPSSTWRWPTSGGSPPGTGRRSSWRGRRARRPSRPAALDLRIRALGLEGLARAKHGDYEGGLETVRGGLALALEHDLTAVAAELYQRLSVTLYDSADYRRAEEALDTALELCRTSPDAGTEVACVTCMAYVLRERGEWPRAAADEPRADRRAHRRLRRRGPARRDPRVRGQAELRAPAARLLARHRVAGQPLQHDRRHHRRRSPASRPPRAPTTRRASAAARSLARWEDSDDHHYAVGGIRWAAAFFAARGDRDGAHGCAEALTRIASETGHADALAALAHAIAETALLEGDPDAAADQLSRAVELHRDLDMPFERAQIEFRAGVALAAAGERELGARAPRRRLPHGTQARRAAAGAAEAAREVAALGESVAAPPRPPRRRRRRRRRPVATRARGRAACSRSAAPTGRSRRTCSSARARSTCTCATSCASSTAARASRPPGARGSSG